MQSFELMHTYLFDQVPINQKFNVVFAIKFIFDAGEPYLISLIETYFLQKFFQIATTDIGLP